jgi:hypothetical protein
LRFTSAAAACLVACPECGRAPQSIVGADGVVGFRRFIVEDLPYELPEAVAVSRIRDRHSCGQNAQATGAASAALGRAVGDEQAFSADHTGNGASAGHRRDRRERAHAEGARRRRPVHPCRRSRRRTASSRSLGSSRATGLVHANPHRAKHTITDTFSKVASASCPCRYFAVLRGPKTLLAVAQGTLDKRHTKIRFTVTATRRTGLTLTVRVIDAFLNRVDVRTSALIKK